MLYAHEINRLIEQAGGSVDDEEEQNYDIEPNAPQQAKKNQSANAVPLFGAPEDYAHLSMEERKKLTQEMMAKHKSWVEGSKPTGGKETRYV